MMKCVCTRFQASAVANVLNQTNFSSGLDKVRTFFGWFEIIEIVINECMNVFLN